MIFLLCFLIAIQIASNIPVVLADFIAEGLLVNILLGKQNNRKKMHFFSVFVSKTTSLHRGQPQLCLKRISHTDISVRYRTKRRLPIGLAETSDDSRVHVKKR